MATKKRAAKKTAPKTVKKTAKKTRKASPKASTKTKVVKPKVPFIATKEGLDELRYHCQGIMDLVGEYLVMNNPKISQKEFQTEAQGMIRSFFGIEKSKGR
jgi:hypothetical protein